MAIVISADQRAQFADDGFIVFEDVFDAKTMGDLDQVLEAFFQRHEQELIAAGGASGISRAGEILFSDHIAEKDDRVKDFCLRQEFVDLTTQLLGPNTDLYWNQTVYKAPEGDKEFPWHQDDGYTPVDPSPYLTIWLAVTEANAENGCISVLPGSHKYGLVKHEPTPFGWACYSADAADQGLRVPVRAGSLIAFSSLLFHKSGPNHSKGMRKAYVIQYSHAGLKHGETGEVFEGKLAVARNGVKAG
jgi:ectoine hydroxylase-related dioxygenase (phytanoyl-CoA dioxygenase family)